jgi:predicted transcriptional regulator
VAHTDGAFRRGEEVPFGEAAAVGAASSGSGGLADSDSGASVPADSDSDSGANASIGPDSAANRAPSLNASLAADPSPDRSRSHAADHDPSPNGRDPAAVRSFIESFTGQLTQAGFPRTPARIFVALLTSDSSRLTAAELGELLQTSPASVSSGVRYLIQVGLARAEGEPGSRRQHYRMPADVWDEIVRLRNRQLAQWATELRDGVTALGQSTPAGGRMADTVRYFEFLSAEMSSILARWHDHAASAESARPAPTTRFTLPGLPATPARW